MNKAQTTLVMGQLGFPAYGKGYYARLVGNDIFGGAGLNSVLADEVREKRGLAYFAHSQLMHLQGNGPFVMLSQSRTQKALKAYQTMLHSYHHFLQKGVTNHQLKEAKRSLIGRKDLANVTNKGLLSNLIQMAFYHYPTNYFKTFAKNIQAVDNGKNCFQFFKLENKATGPGNGWKTE